MTIAELIFLTYSHAVRVAIVSPIGNDQVFTRTIVKTLQDPTLTTVRGKSNGKSEIAKASKQIILSRNRTRRTRLHFRKFVDLRLSYGERQPLVRQPGAEMRNRIPRHTLSPPLTPSRSPALSTIAASRVSRFR